MILKKLKGGGPPITETLDSQFISQVINTLFPLKEEEEGFDPIPQREWEWDEEAMEISRGELRDAIRKIKNGKAPGPDGIHGKDWALAYRGLAEPMRKVYTLSVSAWAPSHGKGGTNSPPSKRGQAEGVTFGI